MELRTLVVLLDTNWLLKLVYWWMTCLAWAAGGALPPRRGICLLVFEYFYAFVCTEVSCLLVGEKLFSWSWWSKLAKWLTSCLEMTALELRALSDAPSPVVFWSLSLWFLRKAVLLIWSLIFFGISSSMSTAFISESVSSSPSVRPSCLIVDSC